jgi:tRNA(fMet)-specific endonuclease VapC
VGYLLDTNILIEIGDLNEHVAARFGPNVEESCMSVLSLVELERGITLAPAVAEMRRERLAALLSVVPVLSFDEDAAAAYGKIIAQTGWNRSRDFDRMIAAHAIAADCTLITANVADFRDIPGLKIENWAAG